MTFDRWSACSTAQATLHAHLSSLPSPSCSVFFTTQPIFLCHGFPSHNLNNQHQSHEPAHPELHPPPHSFSRPPHCPPLPSYGFLSSSSLKRTHIQQIKIVRKLLSACIQCAPCRRRDNSLQLAKMNSRKDETESLPDMWAWATAGAHKYAAAAACLPSPAPPEPPNTSARHPRQISARTQRNRRSIQRTHRGDEPWPSWWRSIAAGAGRSEEEVAIGVRAPLPRRQGRANPMADWLEGNRNGLEPTVKSLYEQDMENIKILLESGIVDLNELLLFHTPGLLLNQSDKIDPLNGRIIDRVNDMARGGRALLRLKLKKKINAAESRKISSNLTKWPVEVQELQGDVSHLKGRYVRIPPILVTKVSLLS